MNGNLLATLVDIERSRVLDNWAETIETLRASLVSMAKDGSRSSVRIVAHSLQVRHMLTDWADKQGFGTISGHRVVDGNCVILTWGYAQKIEVVDYEINSDGSLVVRRG